MKKNYETPKVEKMEFNYSETVVASTSCGNKHVVGDQFPKDPCSDVVYPETYYVSDKA